MGMGNRFPIYAHCSKIPITPFWGTQSVTYCKKRGMDFFCQKYSGVGDGSECALPDTDSCGVPLCPAFEPTLSGKHESR